MKKTVIQNIISHPDRDEILSKIIIKISPKDINEWLAAKYSNINEKKFVISEKNIKEFQENYLDIYSLVQEDLSKTRLAIKDNSQDSLELSIQNLPEYKNLLLQTVNEEVDIRKIIKNLCIAIETRLSQVFDEIQADPRNINTKIDRLLIDYAEVLGNILEKYYKFTEGPLENVTQHNITLQVADRQIGVIIDSIKEILSEIDIDASLQFLEIFNERISKLKMPSEPEHASSEFRLAEAKILNETINKKLNDI